MRICTRIVLGLRLALIGLVAWAGWRYRDELGAGIRALSGLHPLVLLVLLVFCLWNLLAAQGWRVLFGTGAAGDEVPSLWRLWVVRLEAQAINLVVPLASVGGEVLKATVTSRNQRGMTGSAFAVLQDDLASAGAGVLFTAIGAAGHFALLPEGERLLCALVAVAALIGVALVVAPSLLGRLRDRIPARWGGGRDDPGGGGEVASGAALARSVAWHLGERVLTAGEIYLAMIALSLPASPSDALFATAVMTGLSLVFFFVPGQVGAAELGLATAMTALGFPAPAAFGVALVRRARQVVTCLAGVLLLLSEGRTRELRPHRSTAAGGVP